MIGISMTRERFSEIFRSTAQQCVGDVDDELAIFFKTDYKIIELNGNGVIGYSETDDFYFIWLVNTDKLLSNAKIVYNIVKELSKDKAVLYSGVEDFYKNNSIKLRKDLYQIKIGESNEL